MNYMALAEPGPVIGLTLSTLGFDTGHFSGVADMMNKPAACDRCAPPLRNVPITMLPDGKSRASRKA